jgi:hypothetical protein
MERKWQYGNSVASMAILLLVCVAAGPARAHPPDHDHGHHDQVESGTEHGTMGEIGAKLSNPVSDVWALFTEFDLSFSSGNFNSGDDKVGASMNFQPILPVPLAEGWKMIVRPAVPIQFVKPQPDRGSIDNTYDYRAGLADIILPLVISPVMDNWIVAAGPTFLFPTSSSRDLGNQQWGMGPAAVLGYKTPDYVLGIFPQYFWRLADRGDQRSRTPNLSQGQLLYFAFYNLPNAWQVGFNPVITYNDKASSGNKWNVPVGMGFSKTTKIAGRPVKFQFAVEYSVVSQDDFGKRALIKLNVIPVIQGLIKNPLFGGG